jgi:serine/threonine-protein kinase RsbW
MAAIARECGLEDHQVDDVRLAVSEAVTNAVRHAYNGRDRGDVTGTAHVDDGTLRIVIADAGNGMREGSSDNPGLGLGLRLIARLSQMLEVVSNGTGTEIHMTFPCPGVTTGSARPRHP